MFKIAGIAAAAVLAASPVFAAEHVVQMLNKGPDGERMVFEPAVIHAEPGDTVRFVPEDRGHNAATVDGALPEGAEEVRGRINQEIVYEVSETGIHLIQCSPHYALGMIALVISGDDYSNLDQVREVRMPGKADDRFEAYLAEAQGSLGG